ncbi:MAG: hypothetical protein COV91_00805 [Candidatus Taylorbacteria bacterium CG11_big_fil_rev_8_21_14_0_20_46_11]|uniref:5-deoxy-glucuronate isomerase n=1 Tax=Candidatus Taylorbacteria bacterium CG11_big_fil_rev_8_21_14_0_20_46_11 TaxID=1975025 RepID=A0A2H0KEI5_9BACT|nr:MAG: hypothetical protein COV91_00805 [Candidatus Taylorbacteria bacterium CG11_big_fil_rev_8_21_14_0_20_46_11]
MYKWSNEERLDTLTVQAREGAKRSDILTFKAGKEEATVHIKAGTIEKVIFSYDGDKTVILKKEAQAIVVGEGNTKRDVYHFLKPKGPAPTMRLGITVHRDSGTWSSLPHDFELNTEKGFEEVFFYLLKGGSERAIQVGKGVWFDNHKVDSAWFVHNKTFGTVPMGYHPIVGEPGAIVSYVWVYLAKKEKWEKIK